MPPAASTQIHKSQMHCAVQLGIDAAFNSIFKAILRRLRGVWDAIAISLQRSHRDTEIQRYRDTDSRTDKSFKAALRRPSGVWDAAVYIHFMKAQQRHRLSFIQRDTDNRSKLPCAAPQWGARRDSQYTVQSISAVETWNTQSTRLQSQSRLHLTRRWESNQSVYSKSSKVQRRLVTSSVVLTTRFLWHQKLHGHAAFSADILLNCLLRLWRLQRGIMHTFISS